MRKEAPGEARTTSQRTTTTERSSATFEAYYWEAYNEIVQPHKIDLYLIDCWLPHLGPLGFALVKALRRRCYYNPKQGVVRNEVEIDIAELAASVGVNKATIYRELERNESLQQFVRLQHQYASTTAGRAPKRVLPQFLVCMDDPIHPNDLERYENLRARKEMERAGAGATGAPAKFRMKSAPGNPGDGGNGGDSGNSSGKGGEGTLNYVTAPKSQIATKGDLEPHLPKSQIATNSETPKSQIATKGGSKSQFATPQSQFATPQSQIATDAPYSLSLPSEIFTKDLFTSATEISPINPPRGKEESEKSTLPFDPLQAVWNVALSHLSGLVNAPTLNAHIKPIRLISVSEGEGTPGEAVLLLASAFSRAWVETRCRAEIEAALTEALGYAVTVRFTVAGGK
jgi:DNA-binding XRE family transcriptional regulator